MATEVALSEDMEVPVVLRPVATKVLPTSPTPKEDTAVRLSVLVVLHLLEVLLLVTALRTFPTRKEDTVVQAAAPLWEAPEVLLVMVLRTFLIRKEAPDLLLVVQSGMPFP